MSDTVTTAEQRADYRRDGVTVVRNAFASEWLDRLRDAPRSAGQHPVQPATPRAGHALVRR